MTRGSTRAFSRAVLPDRPVLPGPLPGFGPACTLIALLLGSAAAPAADLAACRVLPDDRQRLSCYDQLPDPQSDQQSDQQAPSDSSPEALFGLEAQESAAILQRRLGEEPIQAIEQVITAVAADRFGKLRISLANGQAWEQVDGARLSLKPGDTVLIRRAALGSFLLTRAPGGRSIRVRRAATGTP